MPESALRCGLVSPVLSLLPGTPKWEEAAGPDELRKAATAADRLGYEYVTCSEHVGIPTEVAKVRGPRFYDPLAALSFLAAITQRIKLLSHVLVLPYHHPLAVAKRYGTLDALSGGRVILGIGVGTLKEEFDLLGIDFEQRGERYVDALMALRAALGARCPSFEGSFFRFADFIIDPAAKQQHVPIWLGGRTPRSLRRALELGDGWVPFGLGLDALGDLIAKARGWAEWKMRTRPFEIALALECPADLSRQMDAVTDRVAETQRAGATLISLTVRAESLSHYIDQLELFRERILPRFT